MDILTLIMKYLFNRDLGETFPSEPWTTNNTNVEEPNESCDSSDSSDSSDSGLLIAVIVLAAVMLLLICGAGVAYLRYVRSVF